MLVLLSPSLSISTGQVKNINDDKTIVHLLNIKTFIVKYKLLNSLLLESYLTRRYFLPFFLLVVTITIINTMQKYQQLPSPLQVQRSVLLTTIR